MATTTFERFDAEVEKQTREVFQTLDEKDKRRFAAIQAKQLGHGGMKYISEILAISVSTIGRGPGQAKDAVTASTRRGSFFQNGRCHARQIGSTWSDSYRSRTVTGCLNAIRQNGIARIDAAQGPGSHDRFFLTDGSSWNEVFRPRLDYQVLGADDLIGVDISLHDNDVPRFPLRLVGVVEFGGDRIECSFLLLVQSAHPEDRLGDQLVEIVRPRQLDANGLVVVVKLYEVGCWGGLWSGCWSCWSCWGAVGVRS